MGKMFWAYCALAGLLTLIFVGCETDTQRIRATNEAIAPPVATSTPVPRATNESLSAEIPSVDMEEGDCINSTLPEGISIETVDIVACDGVWKYRVLNTFDVAHSGPYPSIAYFSQQASANCDRRFTYMLYPLEESWKLGDRTVNCLQESFGLSVSDPGKLDRLVSYDSLRLGECFNDAPETLNEQVELVSCSGDWAYRVANRIETKVFSGYPGEDFFEQQAFEECPQSFDFYRYPSPESWELGDRALLCIEEGF